MDAKEFRIGNFINCNGVDCNISEIRYNKVRIIYNRQHGEHQSFVDYEKLKPIPLTEEWINRFVFNDNWASRWIMLEMPVPTGIKYVHQLQNLYFALTGEELTLKK